jgi:hypothetical protein
MASQIVIDGKALLPIRTAVNEVSYSRDYVTRLAREGKIAASLIGRQWFVDPQSLKNYEQQSHIESELRKTQLSEERKAEQLFNKTKLDQENLVLATSSTVHGRAVLMAGVVLCLGLVSGFLGQSFLPGLSAFNASQIISSQSLQAAVGESSGIENTVLLEDLSSVVFSSKEVQDLVSAESGILILPSVGGVDSAEVFSDEVLIKTASSGLQSAVLFDANSSETGREVPFVVVPVNSRNY